MQPNSWNVSPDLMFFQDGNNEPAETSPRLRLSPNYISPTPVPSSPPQPSDDGTSFCVQRLQPDLSKSHSRQRLREPSVRMRAYASGQEVSGTAPRGRPSAQRNTKRPHPDLRILMRRARDRL